MFATAPGGGRSRQQLAYLAIKRWARLYCPTSSSAPTRPTNWNNPNLWSGSGSTIAGTEPKPEKSTADKAREKMGKSRTKTAPIEAEPDVDTILQRSRLRPAARNFDAGALAMRLTSEQDKGEGSRCVHEAGERDPHGARGRRTKSRS
ncbi:MAG: hypothetical protein IPK20_26175 [Betaproteobacteria bacterium]|nr:hypothetical protein [Betaproteobacteria bacterium]